MLNMDSVIVKEKNVPWRMIENEVVLVDIAKGSVIQLNECGAFIWSKIQDDMTVNDVTDCVISEFDVTAQKAQQDTLTFLEQLLKEKLIKIAR